MFQDKTPFTDCLPIFNARGVALPFGPFSSGAPMPVQVWINPVSGRAEPFVVETERVGDGYRRIVHQVVRHGAGQPTADFRPLVQPEAAAQPVTTPADRPPVARLIARLLPSGSGRRHTLFFLLGWLISVTLLLAFFSLMRWFAW